ELTSRRSMEDIIVLMKHAPDVRSEVASLDIPKRVAVGAHDLWPTAVHADFAARIGAELRVYNTGHSPCETTPNALARDMLRLVARSSPAATRGVRRGGPTGSRPASDCAGSGSPMRPDGSVRPTWRTGAPRSRPRAPYRTRRAS